MIKIFENGAEITDKVELASIQIKESLNNRRNTAAFTSIDYEIAEGKTIEIYEGASIMQPLSAWATLAILDDTFEDTGKFENWKTFILWVNTANAEYIEILTVNHTTKQITFAATKNSHSNGDFLGVKKYGGVVIRTPDKNIGKSSLLEYDVELADFGNLFDKKNVVDTYANMYPREIIWRFIYKFCSTDDSKVLFDFEDLPSITPGGTARTPTLDTNDRIAGTASTNAGSTGAGLATYDVNFTAADCTDLKHFRFWLKLPAAAELKISNIKFKIGSSSSNYFEFNDVRIEKDCWNYESFEIMNGVKTGTPDITNIAWARIEITTLSSIPAGDIKFDEMTATAGGFTLKNCDLWPKKMSDVRVQYKKPTVLSENIAKTFKYYWFIDYNKDFNFYPQEGIIAPFELTETSQNFDNLRVQADITNLKNRQVVRGGIAPDQNRYIQERLWDGVTESWYIDYLASDVKVYTDTGAWFIQKTVWVENLVDPTTVDYLFNYNEKVVRRSQDTILTASDKIKIDYIPYKPVRVQIQDLTSINFMKALTGGDGIYDGAVINDNSIKDYDSARDRARAEVQAYSNPILSANFTTNKDGLTIGQTLYITDTNRGLNNQPFVIQQVGAKQKIGWRFNYTISAGSSLYGLTEFFQYLLKQTAKTEIDENEVVDIVVSDDEVMAISDNYVFTHKTRPFYAMGATPGLTPNDAYADFSEAA
jgi:hypothetical protein